MGIFCFCDLFGVFVYCFVLLVYVNILVLERKKTEASQKSITKILRFEAQNLGLSCSKTLDH